ncbi:putative reverse transcriptase domain-containing protein [Tanacetum coccineum]
MAPKRRTTRLNPSATPTPVTDTHTTTSVTNAQIQAMINEGVTAALAARDATRNGRLIAYLRNSQRFQELALMCDRMFPEEIDQVEKYVSGLPDTIHATADNKRKSDDTARNNQNQQTIQETKHWKKLYTAGNGDTRPYGGPRPLCFKCNYHHDGPCAPRCHKCNRFGHLAHDCKNPLNVNIGANQRVFFECGAQEHFKKDCPKLKNNNNRGISVGNAKAHGQRCMRGNVGANYRTTMSPHVPVVIVCAANDQALKSLTKGCHVILSKYHRNQRRDKSKEERTIEVCASFQEFPEVFLWDLAGDKGFIRPSFSPWGAPVLFVKKKDGSFPDVHRLQGIEQTDSENRYPLPDPRSMTYSHQLQGFGDLFKIDLRSRLSPVKDLEIALSKDEELYAKFFKCDSGFQGTIPQLHQSLPSLREANDFIAYAMLQRGCGRCVDAREKWPYLYGTIVHGVHDHKSLQQHLDQNELNMRHTIAVVRVSECLRLRNCVSPKEGECCADALAGRNEKPLRVRGLSDMAIGLLDLPKQI